MARLSPEAQKFVAKKIRENIREGKPRSQAVAIAFSQARAKGFRVPAAPASRKKMGMVA